MGEQRFFFEFFSGCFPRGWILREVVLSIRKIVKNQVVWAASVYINSMNLVIIQPLVFILL